MKNSMAICSVNRPCNGWIFFLPLSFPCANIRDSSIFLKFEPDKNWWCIGYKLQQDRKMTWVSQERKGRNWCTSRGADLMLVRDSKWITSHLLQTGTHILCLNYGADQKFVLWTFGSHTHIQTAFTCIRCTRWRGMLRRCVRHEWGSDA
jgi:hypothetical protein